MADFAPVRIDQAKEFLRKHHWGILATRRKNGNLQMSPVTVGLDAQGRAIISSRETAYKVNNLRRDPRAALCAITSSFHDPEPGPLEILEKQEIREKVQFALNQLEPDDAAVILLRDLQDVSYSEVAQVLEIPVGTVKSRLHRARQALKSRLQSYFSAERKAV